MTASVTVIDTEQRRSVGRLEVGRGPCTMAINPRNDSLYLANSASDTVTRIDLECGCIAATIPVGRGPIGISLSRSGDRIYIGDRAEGVLSVIGADDDQEWARLPTSEAPAGCVVDPWTGYLLVSNAGSATVPVIEELLTGPVADQGVAAHPLVGQPVPAFDLVDLKTGRMRRSREWSERKYVLNFFASW
jgi:YVTN family beta-propeller protein